jgi:hypothetical protein
VLARLAGLLLVPLALVVLGERRRRRRAPPPTPAVAPIVVSAPRSAPDDVPPPIPPAPPPAPPRRSHGRLLLVALVAAIVIVGAPVLYLTLRSSSAPPGPRVLGPMKLVSYYPPNAAWSYMWTRFDRAEIASDLERAHELGFDTVRIFVPPSAFGYPTPSAVMQARLHEVVAAAAAADLRVGLTLFDRFEDYGDEAGSKTWLRDVLHPYANDPAIAFVEVHNEIDPSNAPVRRWYGEMLKVELATAPKIPTVASVPARLGVSGLRTLAHALAPDPPDVYSLHYYGDPAYLVPTLQLAERAVAPKPLILGEVGYSTAAGDPATPGLPATGWAQEAQQSVVLRAAFEATRRLALPAPGIWTLYDVVPGAIPPNVAGDDSADERSFGLFEADGTPKPAVAAVRAYLTQDRISTDINAGFARGGPIGDASQPADWRVFDGQEGSLAWDPEVGHDAPGSVRLTATKGTSGRVPSYYQSIWSVQPSAGRFTRVSAYARGVAIDGDDRIAISWFDANGRYLGQNESARLPAGDPGWTRLVVRAEPPAGAAVLEVHLKSSDERGTVWFDDVSVR